MNMRSVLAAGFFACAGLAVSAPVGFAASADPPVQTVAAMTKAAHLDALFDELKKAPTPEVAKVVEAEIWTEWLSSGDDETDAMMLLAVAAMNTGVLDQALSILDKIVARSPDFAEGWNKRATVYYEINQFDKSLADIEQTLKLEPRHFGALSGLGMIMIKIGDKRRALAAFEKAVEVDPMINGGTSIIEQLKDAIGKAI